MIQCSAGADHDPGIQLPDARFIPTVSERSDDDDESGKLQYIVEVFAVIDHSIFQRSVSFGLSPIKVGDCED